MLRIRLDNGKILDILTHYSNIRNLDEQKANEIIRDTLAMMHYKQITKYSYPIENVKVIVSKDIGNYRVIFFEGNTDSSGIISDIMLPAPETITDPNATPAYTIYNMTAIHSEYEAIKNYSIGMFGDVRVLQYVKMMPQISLEGGQLDND